MANVPVAVLKTDGINCDMEMEYAFEVAGGSPETVHVNELRDGSRNLNEFGVLALPGGFSYGDDIASGKVLATELTSYLSDKLQGFVDAGKPILGVCNGFQTLVRTGLLPDRTLGMQTATLAENEIGRFECRWIDLKVGASVCKFAQPREFGAVLPMQTAHGEGRFFADQALDRLKRNGQIVFRYASQYGGPANGYPENPNGAIDDVAGVCDPSGLILGMMPHPERSVTAFHPNRRQTENARTAANIIFANIVNYAKES